MATGTEEVGAWHAVPLRENPNPAKTLKFNEVNDEPDLIHC
jgi:hypothetical protein